MTYWLEVYAACVGINLVMGGAILEYWYHTKTSYDGSEIMILLALSMTGPVFTLIAIGMFLHGVFSK